MSEMATEAPAAGGDTGMDSGGDAGLTESTASDLDATGAAGDAADETTGTETAAPAFGGYDSPEFQQAVSAAADQAAQARFEAWQAEQNRPPPEDPTAALAERFAAIDPLDPDAGQQYAQTFAEALQAQEQRLREQFRQDPAIQHADQAYAQNWATEQFGKIETALGAPLDDAGRQIVLQSSMGQATSMGGNVDESQLLSTQAKALHDYVTKREQAAVQRYQAGLAGGNGNVEPSVNGTGAIRTEAPARNAAEVTERFLARYQ
jgi:hypothetical protein